MESLHRIFNDDAQLAAYVQAVALHLTKINEYASRRKSPELIEYNVGGVISIVDRLRALAAARGEFHDDEGELAVLLRDAWFIREDGRPRGGGGGDVFTKEFYNSDFDPSATLGIAIAQLLVSLKQDVDGATGQMFETCASLLRRYSGYLQTGREHSAIMEDENGDEHLSLARFFRSLYLLREERLKDNVVRSQDLRNEGNAVFKQGKFGAAIAKYTEAILLDPTNYVLYSNRAACYNYLNAADSAITDLLKSIELNESFQPSWARLGYCYLAQGNASKSVEAYVKAIELANQQELLPQFIRKLVESLNYAEQRARSQGVPSSELENLTQRIRDIRIRYPEQSRSPLTGTSPVPQQQQQPQQQGTYGSNGNQTVFGRFPGGVFAADGGDGNGAETLGGDPQQVNYPVFTDATQNGAIQQAISFMMNAFDQNNATQNTQRGDGQTQQSTATETNTQQQQANNQPGNIGAQSTQQTQNNDADDMADDPEISLPDDSHEQQAQQQHQQQGGQSQGANRIQQQHIPQNIQNVLLGALPNALRNTVAPIIAQTLSNALGGGQNGQGATYTTVSISPDQMNANQRGLSQSTNSANATSTTNGAGTNASVNNNANLSPVTTPGSEPSTSRIATETPSGNTSDANAPSANFINRGSSTESGSNTTPSASASDSAPTQDGDHDMDHDIDLD